MKINVLKAVGLATSIGGIVLTQVSSHIDKNLQQKTINNEIKKQVEKYINSKK